MFISCKRGYTSACLALMLLEASCASPGGGLVPGNSAVNAPSFEKIGALAQAGRSTQTIIGCKIVTRKTRTVLNPPPAQTFVIPPSLGIEPSAYAFYFVIGRGHWCYSLPRAMYTTVPGRVNASETQVTFGPGHNKLVLERGQSYVYAAYIVPAKPAAHLYVIDHGTSDVSVWPTGANGNVAPLYRIKNVGGFKGAPQGIAEDAEGHVIVTTIAADGVTTSVLVYRPGAHGHERPSRIITGPDTTLTNNSSDTGVGPDGSIYVNNGSDIAVFAPNADGDAKPVRIITGLNGAGAAVSPSNLLYTSTAVGTKLTAIAAFGPDAHGPAKPRKMLLGSHTGIAGNLVAVDSQGDVYQAPGSSVIEFAPCQSGNVFPIRNISGSNLHFVGVQPIAVDGAANVFVGDEDGARLYRFEPWADGNVRPVATISGNNTGLIKPAAMAVGR